MTHSRYYRIGRKRTETKQGNNSIPAKGMATRALGRSKDAEKEYVYTTSAQIFKLIASHCPFFQGLGSEGHLAVEIETLFQHNPEF